MCHAHEKVTLRCGVMGAVSFRLRWGVVLALAIGIWTSPEAWALTVSPTALNFQAVQGGANPPNQIVNVSKSNTGSTSWIAMDNATWLLASPGVGTITSTAQVALAVRSAGLAAGTYTAMVTITVDKGGSTSIPVTLTVLPPPTSTTPPVPAEPAGLTVSPATLTFQAVQGGANPPNQIVNVSKSNTGSTSWIAMDNATWLLASPGVGTITSTAQVALAVRSAGLAAGTYTAMVTITVDKGGTTSLPVTLRVVPATTSGTSTTSGSSTTPTTSTNPMASLTWSPVTNTNLAGYKVYVGTASGRYGTPLDVGNVTSYVVSNLALGNTYYFVVTSYNTSGGESLPSTEVSKSIY